MKANRAAAHEAQSFQDVTHTGIYLGKHWRQSLHNLRSCSQNSHHYRNLFWQIIQIMTTIVWKEKCPVGWSEISRPSKSKALPRLQADLLTTTGMHPGMLCDDTAVLGKFRVSQRKNQIYSVRVRVPRMGVAGMRTQSRIRQSQNILTRVRAEAAVTFYLEPESHYSKQTGYGY